MQISKDAVVVFHYRLTELGGSFTEDSRTEEPVAYLCTYE